MKQITNRAVSVLLLAAFVIVGTLLYVIRFVDHGQDWAAAYSRENAGVSGALIDRNGVVLASYSPYESLYQEDEELRRANYHVTGDYYGRTGTGLLTDYQDYSLFTGTSRSRNAVLSIPWMRNRTRRRGLISTAASRQASCPALCLSL